MFINTYLAIPLWIFGVFGFIYFILCVFDSLSGLGKRHKDPCTLIISAKNKQHVIEGIVKGFILNCGMDVEDQERINILLVDLDSSDRTEKIMKKLEKDYSMVRLIKPEELQNCAEDIIDV